MKTKAHVETRSQPAKGTWPKQGPDTYVAVQYVPVGIEPLKVLNRAVAAKRGIEIRYIGEGYRNRIGQTSMLGRAIQEAWNLANFHNS